MRTERYLSLGAGVQSSVLILMVDRGVFGEPGVDAPSVAYFADTQAEPPDVYDHLRWLESEVRRVEIVRVGERSLLDDSMNGVNSVRGAFGGGQIPVFTINERGGRIEKGINPRQCTSRYKIRPIERAARARFGAPHPARLTLEAWMGISVDEAYRIKEDARKSYRRVYPLADKGMRRSDCAAWFAERYPSRELPRSACYFCPYHSADEWVRLRDRFPAEFERAVELDETIRTQPPIERGLTRYLHQRRVPLRTAVEIDERALAAKDAQLTFPNDWLNECEGVCAV